MNTCFLLTQLPPVCTSRQWAHDPPRAASTLKLDEGRRKASDASVLASSLAKRRARRETLRDAVHDAIARFRCWLAECRCGVDPSPGWSGPPCEAPMERSSAGGPSGRALRPECRRLRERPRSSAAVGVARAPSPDA
ncbi:hypothetical protein HPB47_007098 [Ixodes persulcatus]|uniref:Uncharacterized protein n=1 Tax=Ixodes persulcatus TaxID=34615 RepID=A0AC60P8L8_IXOPE|nr:hypothetical protein HPB47_007098 [Ixodes persulcatus]